MDIDLKDMDIEAEARAIETDAGKEIPGLREALADLKAGIGRVHTPAQIMVRTDRRNQADSTTHTRA